MNITIRLAKKSDLRQYTDLLQKTNEHAYVNDSIGLTKECFSKEVFNTPDTQKYLTSNLVVNEKQKTWLAFHGEKLVGSITMTEKENEFEMRAFYVSPKHQGKGIGKKLWKLARKHAGQKNIILDIFAHNTKTIEMYKSWGFEMDEEKGGLCRHWPEWPEGLKATCLYMRLKTHDI